VRRDVRQKPLALSIMVGAAHLLSSVSGAQAQDGALTQDDFKAITLDGGPITMYRESFGYCTDTIGASAARETRWAAFVGGLSVAKFSNLKVFSYGSQTVGGSVNSNPFGLSQGYSFWFRPTSALTVFTKEFEFSASILRDPTTVIEYEQRLTGINTSSQPDRTQLAFLIDSTWYISQESVQQSKLGIWEAASVRPASLTWGAVPAVGNLGPVAPSSFGVTLPLAGTVQAFGLFLGEVNGRVRFDNFTILSDHAPGGAAQYPIVNSSFAACPDGSPDRTGQPPTNPTPNPDEDGSQGPISDEPGPIAPQYEFCPTTEQGRGRRIELSPKLLARLVKPIGRVIDMDLRDRAIFALFSGRKLPMGAVINLKVSDYDVKTGVLTIRGRRATAVRTIKLKSPVRAALNAYLSQAELGADSAPLFPRVRGVGSELSQNSALCMTELRALIKRRAKDARVSLNEFVRR
jgi:hypothetical protein